MTGFVFVVPRWPRNRHFDNVVILSVISAVIEMKYFQALIWINILGGFKLVLGVPGPLEPAQPHEFPFQVSFGTSNSHYCSGALLNEVSDHFLKM